MKKVFSIFVMCLMAVCLNSCYFTNPSYDKEVAFKQKPWFVGETGVQDEPCTSLTFYCQTTSAVEFYMLPVKHEFTFDDLLSNDNTQLDVKISMTLQIQKGGTPELLRYYGENWYETFIDPYFKNKVREYVSTYSPFDLMSNREILKEFDNKIANDMTSYIANLSKKHRFPIDVIQVLTDRVMPNKLQKDEMDQTAAMTQKKRTQEVRCETEDARAKAEVAKAKADKAYMREMNLNADQWLMLQLLEKSNPNVDVVLGGTSSSMWNIRR